MFCSIESRKGLTKHANFVEMKREVYEHIRVSYYLNNGVLITTL